MEVALFAFMGFLGALAYRLAWSRSFEELRGYESLRHLALGPLVGLVYYHLHTDYGFPDKVMTFVAGWAGADFLEAFISRVRRPVPGGGEG